MSILIADISKYQSITNVSKLKKLNGVIARIGFTGYGTGALTEDGSFSTHLEKIKKANIPMGVYYFTLATTEKQAIAEATFVINTLHKYNLNLELPVFIDCERQDEAETTAFKTGKSNQGTKWNALSRLTRTTVIRAFCKTIEDNGYKAGVYCNLNWANNFINMGALTNYYTWIAQYANKCTYSGRVDMWQYTSTGNAEDYGIKSSSNKLDLSYCFVDFNTKKEYPKPTRVLKVTTPLTKGEDVKWVQSKLVSKGYNVDVDGAYGKNTEKAVKDFQQKTFVDGIVGELTIEKLSK